MKTIKDIIGLLAVAGFLFLLFSKKDAPSGMDLVAVDVDSITKQWNEKERAWEYSRLQYEATTKELNAHLSARGDSLSKALHALSRRPNVKDATLVTAVTKVDTIVKTVEKDGVYHSEYLTEYIRIRTNASRDSTAISLQMKLPLSISKEKDGRITVSTPVKEVEITELTGFTKVTPDRKRNWKYIVGGVVGGAIIYSATR